MSLKLDDDEFLEKYKFDINDFYYACIKEIMKPTYWCQTVSELAYDIAYKIYDEIGDDGKEYGDILYKLTESTPFDTKIYTHNIAIPYEDIYVTFKIRWIGNSLSVCNWDLFQQEEIINDKNYESIDLLEDELEEMEE